MMQVDAGVPVAAAAAAALPATTPTGAERMAGLPVAARVNFNLFQQAAVGAPVRVGGRLSADRRLTTTDGGTLAVLADAAVLPQDGWAADRFVEVVGTKANGTELQAAGVVVLPGSDVDAELWDEAVKLAHLPQLRDLFAPQQEERA